MFDNCSTYNIPSFRKNDVYTFDTPKTFTLYEELNNIAEEIEKCRLNHS